MNSIISHFENIALISMEKQDGLLRRLGEHFADFDFDEGVARFDPGTVLPIQVLGTESDNSLTWLWAWADEHTEVSETLLRSARELKTWGTKEGLFEFTAPSFDLDPADGNMLALMATEICSASGYYRDPYDGGAVFLLLFGAGSDRRHDLDRTGLIRAMRDLASRYDIDHRRVLSSYFAKKGLPSSGSGDTVNAELAGGERLIARFDPAGRILTINGDSLT